MIKKDKPKKILYAIIFLYSFFLLLLAYKGLNFDDNLTAKALHYFSPEEVKNSQSLFSYRLIVFSLYRIVELLFLILLYKTPFIGFISDKIKNLTKIRFISYFSIFLLLYFLIKLILFPFSVYGSYYISSKYNLLTMPFLTWTLRFWSSVLINGILVSLGLSLSVILMKHLRLYYITVPLVLLIFALAYSYVYPQLIIPRYYKTAPLVNKEKMRDIRQLAQKSQIKLDSVMVIYKSTYYKTANAFLIGFGPTRSIYIYDTLLNDYSQKEMLAVMAHEIGHYKEEDMTKGILLSSFSLILLLIFFELFNRFFKLQKDEILKEKNFPLIGLILIILMFFARPVENTYSRYIEKRADSWALTLTDDRKVMKEVNIKLSKQNKSLITPNSLYYFWNYSHPHALDRIDPIKKYLK